MKSNILTFLTKILQILSIDKKLIVNTDLISITDEKILIAVGDAFSLLNNHKSNLQDEFVDINLVQKFVNNLSSHDVLVRINHIGFCYKVTSQEQEKERLTKLIRDTDVHLYVESSNDEGKWFFIGNTDSWEDSMIELIPIEKTLDKWANYWLPHIQIDIDTTLTEEEIKNYVKSVFGETITPYSIKIDGVVYIVRNRLGTIDGVNVTIDLATSSRNVKYQRLNLLKRVDA